MSDHEQPLFRVWEYDVPERSRGEFERVYGAEGEWAQLFSSSDGFEGTELFGSVARPGRYLTIDRFRNEAAWQQFLVTHRDAYRELDALTAGLARVERNLVGPDAD